MSQPTKSEYFNYTFSPGRIGNSKIVITAEPKAAECIARIATDEGKWRKHQDTFIAVMEQRPSKKWITETSHAVYEEYMKTGDEQILNDWTDCVKGGIAQLPKILLAQEEEKDIPARRRKRFIYALAEYDDIRSKEMIMGLGFRWNTQKRMFEYYGEPAECKMLLNILAEKNLPQKMPVIDDDKMFKYFALKPAQEESIRFIFKQLRAGWHGTLVADDMGVGKTLTSLVAGKMAVDAGLVSRIVVFANTSNIDGWLKEWGRLPADKTGMAFAVTTANLAKAKYRNDAVLQNELESAELIIVNYEYAARNEKVLTNIVSLCNEAMTVFDEITKCANPETSNFKAAFKASMMSRFAVGLSGTPISKEIYEGWSIFRLLDPSIFPKKEFIDAHRVEKTMRIWDPRKKQSREIITYEYRCPDQFQKRISSHFIRHEKTSENIEATKDEKCLFISSESPLMEIRIADMIHAKTSSHMKQAIDWDMLAGDNARLPKWQVSVLGYIQSALDDPYVIYESDLFHKITDANFETSEEQQIVYDIMNRQNAEKLQKYVPAKLRFVEEQLLSDWKDKHTILFFSSSRACERAATRLTEDFPKMEVQTIIGSVPTKQREERVEEFRNAPAGVLCCTDAMAFGCNLQFADVLVHMNLPWSTAVLKQRSDRIFRTGAEGQKEIYYLMLEHPLERRKINVLNKNLETIRKSLNIEMTTLPEEVHVTVPSVVRTGKRRGVRTKQEKAPVDTEPIDADYVEIGMC